MGGPMQRIHVIAQDAPELALTAAIIERAILDARTRSAARIWLVNCAIDWLIHLTPDNADVADIHRALLRSQPWFHEGKLIHE